MSNNAERKKIKLDAQVILVRALSILRVEISRLRLEDPDLLRDWDREHLAVVRLHLESAGRDADYELRFVPA
jgi:hypothetical protein